MKKLFIVCLALFVFSGIAFAEVVKHSGKRGVFGKLGDEKRVWRQLHVQDIIMEGATSDGYETTLSIEDPAADRTFNLTAPKRISIPLASVFCDGGNDIDDASTPDITTVDNVAAIVYASSAETAGIQFPWAPSANYVEGMQLEVVVSSSTADGTDVALGWSIFVHDSNTSFDSAITQTGGAATGATLDASVEVITLTLNATGEAAITAGSSVVTIELCNSAIVGSLGTTEIKAITIIEP